MRTTPYELSTSLTLYPTKLDVLWQLSKGLLGVKGWRVKAIMGWLFFSTAYSYLAVFPTLIDAISGYEAWVATRLLLLSGTAIDVGQDYDHEYHVYTLVLNTRSHMTQQNTKAKRCNGICKNSTIRLCSKASMTIVTTALNLTRRKSENIDRRADQHLYHWGFLANSS